VVSCTAFKLPSLAFTLVAIITLGFSLMHQVNQLAKLRLFLLFLGGLSALAPLSIDAYLPAIPEIARYFNVDIVAANLTMTAFLIGNGVGQFFGGALSDHLGRKPVGLMGLGLFILSTVLILFADSIVMVQALRFSQAIGGGFATVICLAQVRDVYPLKKVAKKMAKVMMVVLLAPLFAPVLGALLMQLGWKLIFVLLAVYAAVFFILYLVYIPETRQAERKPLGIKSLFTGYLKVAAHRSNGRLTAIRYSLFTAFTMGIFMTFLTNASMLYMQVFKLGEFQFAAAFAFNALMLMVGNLAVIRLMDRYSALTILRTGNLAQVLILLLTVILLFVGVESFWLFFTTLLLLMLFNGAIMPTASGAYISFFDTLSGSAASFNATLLFLTGSLIGAAAAVMSKGQLLPIFSVMLLSALIARLMLRGVEPALSEPGVCDRVIDAK
jgi:DHA1 family bicyclomycin/chloramphenicol resistance-like MFS transporter